MEKYDIVIIGGGPNGLACGYRFSKEMPSKRILILEKNKILNSLRNYPNVLWHSTMKELKLPSYLNGSIEDKYSPTSSELVKYYQHFASEHRLNILEDHEVIDIVKSDFEEVAYNLEVQHDNQILRFNSKIIIICSGIYENPRKLPIKSDYNFCSNHFEVETKNKKLLLVGGGNSATDYIIHLLPKNKITWVIRGSTWKSEYFTLTKKFNEIMSLYSDNLTLYLNTSVKEISADRTITLSNNVVIDEIDECNLLLGYNSRNILFEKIGLEFDHECLKLYQGYETNLKNIYAFGSVMAPWDLDAPKQTFIHNGNQPELEEIINHVIKKELDGIMNDKKIHTTQLSISPDIKRNFFEKLKGRLKLMFGINNSIKLKYDKVMIVAHPDDETLWGGEALEQEKGWLVICLTNSQNKLRADKFNKAMDIFQVERKMYNFPDLGNEPFTLDVLKDLEIVLANIVNQPLVKKVVTHGPDGEYGHAAHKTISSIIKNVISDENRLHYFSFSKPGREKVSEKKQKAFDVYFDSVNDDLWFAKLIRTASFVLKYAIKFILNKLKIKDFYLPIFKESLFNIYQAKAGIAESDLEHCNLSRFENIVHNSEYRNYDDILNENYSYRGLPINVRDIYLRNRELYDTYTDRKYMITEYLPTCVGKTLGVGCHEYNQYDAYCLPTPSDYETIDISDKWRVYGSPFKHTTADFLTYSPGYKFNHIVLFGVMGIPYQSEGDEDTYTLYGGDEKCVKRVDELLNVNGTVLFGPDFSIDKSKSMTDKFEYWDDFFNNNEILNSRYKLVTKFSTDVNFVIVCKKLA